MKILFKNADILVRKEGKIDFHRDAYLATDGKLISYIGKEEPKGEFDEVKNMRGKLLMPGFYNAHTHTPMNLLRGVGSGHNLQDWLFNCIFPLEDKMKTEDTLAGAKLAQLEMIAGGTVGYEDMYWNYGELLPEILDAGLKINAGAVIQYAGPAEFAVPFTNKRVQATEELAKYHKGDGDGLFNLDIQMHSEYLMTEEFMQKSKEIKDKYNLSVHAHFSETKSEHEESIKRHGKTPIAYYDSFGLLDGGAVCAHCVWITDEDMEILKRTGSAIAHNPESNLKLGSGIAPIAKALKKGVNVAIGTDGVASNNNLNMFEEMHIASILQNGANHDPLALSAQDAFDMATYNGAKALHRRNSGELAVGKDADIVAINMDALHLIPDNDTLALLVYSAQSSDVCLNMVNGKILYENGEFYTLDKEKVLAEFKEAHKRVFA